MTRWRWWLVLLACVLPLAQAATVRAFLDRDHVSLGDTVTLNLQADHDLGTPDLAPLARDFQVLGTSQSSSVRVENGQRKSSYQLGIALKPLHAGTLVIPALDVGGARTAPLQLHVGAAPSGGLGKAGDPVFMESSVRSSSPYVGQQTVYTTRLFYQPGVDGSLGDPEASGARLVQLDRDRRYVTQRDGYTYQVIERSWALIPGRTGAITIRGPTFEGRKLGASGPNGWFRDPNSLLNAPFQSLMAPVRATAPTVRIEARAEPASGGKPWLPARGLTLKLSGLPADGKATVGVPVTVTLVIDARGLPADALPEPELPPIAGARVYPDQVRDHTDDSGEWLEGTRTRSFAIVPERDGKLVIPAISLDWWDLGRDQSAHARVAAHTLEVHGAAAATAPPPPAAGRPAAAASSAPLPGSSAAAAGSRTTPVAANPTPRWRWLALASLALWGVLVAVAIAWWWRRRGSRANAGTDRPVALGAAPAAAEAMRPEAAPGAHALQREAMAAAGAGDAAACERALLAWARATHPELAGLDALRGQLDDPAQRDALDALQRARWRDGDAATACAFVARAFAEGLHWRAAAGSGRRDHGPGLPPLYPPP